MSLSTDNHPNCTLLIAGPSSHGFPDNAGNKIARIMRVRSFYGQFNQVVTYDYHGFNKKLVDVVPVNLLTVFDLGRTVENSQIRIFSGMVNAVNACNMALIYYHPNSITIKGLLTLLFERNIHTVIENVVR